MRMTVMPPQAASPEDEIVVLADPLKDKQALEDVQGRSDGRNVALQAAGVSGVEMPLLVQERNGNVQEVAAKVAMAVALPPDEKGTHMSRFIVQLAEWSRQRRPISLASLQAFLEELCERLNADEATVDMAFKLFQDKAAPVTGQYAPMGYDVRYFAQYTRGALDLRCTVNVPISTLCPCSKSISDYGAHNQRAIVTLETAVDVATLQSNPLWAEDLLDYADLAATCPVYPLLKRLDEKWVTERQYDNPKFVEDVARDLILAMRDEARSTGFAVRVEALESIHAHNAWAAHRENLPA